MYHTSVHVGTLYNTSESLRQATSARQPNRTQTLNSQQTLAALFFHAFSSPQVQPTFFLFGGSDLKHMPPRFAFSGFCASGS